MAGPEGLIQVLALSERENAGGESDPVTGENDTAIMNGVVRKKNRLQHFRCRFAIDYDSGLDDVLKLNALLNGDDRANAHFGHPFHRLNDDFDIFALLASRIEERQIPQLRKHAAKF